MFKKLRNWKRLIKFIIKHRAKGNSSFMLLTTSTEIIIVPEDKLENDKNLRLNY